MKLKMISWNVKGLINHQKHLVVRNLLREWKCDVVCLQETKLAGMDRLLVCSLWSCPNVDRVMLDADRIASGVLILWDKRFFRKVGRYSGNFLNIGLVARADRWIYLGMLKGLAQMKVARGVTCGMNWLVFSNIGVALII